MTIDDCPLRGERQAVCGPRSLSVHLPPIGPCSKQTAQHCNAGANPA
eukprot:CAMPEP_0119066028 /NCGR_PEP_ID=MMETSP1178-20130426/8697_1 /TAXON_ID=33656 /ORGANISM="unid sp, Strain CCMP2000" /LENGTH=46 /DNA_ID= /DNA_START= /DNA_END= /DNA_ORIENTATION=